MLRRATYTGKSEIMKAYDAINSEGDFNFSLWHSDKDIAVQYTGDDKEKCREMLDDNLEAMEQAGNTDLLLLKFHPPLKGKWVDRKTTTISTTPIRVCALDSEDEKDYSIGSATRPAGMPYQLYEAIGALKQLPDAINAKLDSFEVRLKEIELMEIEEPEPVTPLQQITGLLSNEAVMSAFGQLLNFLKPQPAYVPGIRMNGMTEIPPVNEPVVPEVETAPAVNEDLVNDALNRLHPYCKLDDDLQTMAHIAETNPVLWQAALGMLRAQKV